MPLHSLVAVFVVLLLVSAFFSISETSMMALNRYRLKHLAKTGSRAAKLASQLLSETDKLLGVVLLGNNVINAAVASLATVIAFRWFGQSELAVSIATGIAAFFLLVFAEITPKVIGASYPERIALPASYVLVPLLKAIYPVVWFVNLFVKSLLTLLRLQPPPTGQATALSLEELRTLVLEGGHFLPAKHQKILLNLFDLQSITVDDLMTPRSQIEVLDIDALPEELKRQISTSNHSRLPVYRGTLDNIIGILHVRKMLNLGADDIRSETLLQIMRPPYFVPVGTPLLAQLQHFQEEEERLGLVVDEYGELMGLITLEDILEEIIGEFTTHSPLQAGGITRQDDGSVLAEGVTPLREINRKLGTHFPLDGPKTLNGLVLEHLEDIPETGTTVKIAGHPIEIVQTQDRAIRSARIYPRDPPNNQ
ncbi:MAG: magnesium and cobalt efflux protein CorC [Proteobacteria bacterium]|nr:MAG: magnesium and cobalt efflux protein CorC [Pseudomonadota bacterium]